MAWVLAFLVCLACACRTLGYILGDEKGEGNLH